MRSVILRHHLYILQDKSRSRTAGILFLNDIVLLCSSYGFFPVLVVVGKPHVHLHSFLLIRVNPGCQKNFNDARHCFINIMSRYNFFIIEKILTFFCRKNVKVKMTIVRRWHPTPMRCDIKNHQTSWSVCEFNKMIWFINLWVVFVNFIVAFKAHYIFRRQELFTQMISCYAKPS